MFCIAAFIILAFLGIFSARYRKLATDAWKCVSRKVTFRKCDTSFKEDLKSRLLARHAVKRPRLAGFLDKWLDVLALVFVALTIWSLFVVIKSGLNLYVYDTCNPNNAASCSLGAEACGVNTGNIGFWQAVKSGRILTWTKDEAVQFGETIKRVPDRLRDWQPAEYTDQTSSYYNPYDPAKPTAFEVIDPGCVYCANLFRNLTEAGVESRYNLTYVAYPIPDATTPNGYKFAHSPFVASFLEAVKRQPLEVTPSADWQLLERIFTWTDEKGQRYQDKINMLLNEAEVDDLLQAWLVDIGYDTGQAAAISAAARSQAISDQLAENKKLVEERIKTVKIPTLLIDGRRYDGVVEADKLR